MYQFANFTLKLEAEEKKFTSLSIEQTTRIITIIIMPPKQKIEAHKRILYIEFMHEKN